MDKAKKINIAEDAPAAVKVKKRKSKSLDRKKGRLGWFFIAPFLIGFVLIYLPMIVDSIYFSFVKIEAVRGGGYNPIWVGLRNYSYALLEDESFSTKLIESLKQLAFNIPAIVIFSLFMAVLLNQKMKGRAVFRAIFFIPVIVSTGIVESIEVQNSLAEAQSQMTDISSGTMSSSSSVGNELISILQVERFFSGMKVGNQLLTYVVAVVTEVYSIINKAGVQMLIFLAGLQSISPAIYESCKIEGASSWEIFWKITFPMISPMIFVNTIYTVIDSFTSQSNTVIVYINEIYGKAEGNVRSTAMSWIYFMLVLLILALVAAILSAYIFYQRRD
ncbi:MAG: sugar ABC transporter permease [Eubacteriales bacterium]|nr:sugar ABC transporter permease [Eubacteriales bacterium]